jgi:cysteine desulfurase
MSRIYLDYNATAPLRPEARDALLAALDIGNPSSVHEEGRKAPAGEIKRLLVSAIEHSAVLAAAKESGLPVEELPVTPDGVLDLDALDAALADDTPALVCVMLANNETGVIQPIAEVAAKTRAHGSLLFCDGVQAAGKIDINLFALGVDALSLSGHKLGAPMGVGALVTRPAVVVPPQLIGGGQELGRRAGSENISGITAFAAAARAAMRDLEAFADLADRRDEMEAALLAAQAQLVVYGKGAPRLANTSCFALSGLNAETLVMAMDLAGISVSAGSACSSGKVSRSHVLAAMQAEPHISKGVLRVSLGWQSRAEDTQKLVNEWSKLAGQTLAAE